MRFRFLFHCSLPPRFPLSFLSFRCNRVVLFSHSFSRLPYSSICLCVAIHPSQDTRRKNAGISGSLVKISVPQRIVTEELLNSWMLRKRRCNCFMQTNHWSWPVIQTQRHLMSRNHWFANWFSCEPLHTTTWQQHKSNRKLLTRRLNRSTHRLIWILTTWRLSSANLRYWTKEEIWSKQLSA